MTKIDRRKFARAISIAAAFAPALLNADAVTATVSQNATRDSTAQNAQTSATAMGKSPSTGLTPDQYSQLADAIALRDVQLAQLHAQPLPYDLEPAFVFRARVAPRSGRKP